MSVDIVTFGCRLNTHESEVMRRQAQAAGIGEAVVVNTCAVTAEAVRQVVPVGSAVPPVPSPQSSVLLDGRKEQLPLSDSLDNHERALIQAALGDADGVVAEAARLLQTDRANLYRRMKRLGLGD